MGYYALAVTQGWRPGRGGIASVPGYCWMKRTRTTGVKNLRNTNTIWTWLQCNKERKETGSVTRQTTFFITLKVPVVGGWGVGVGVITIPSREQVALFPGWVHIRFAHSWFTLVSNPLADPLFLHSSMVSVLPFLLFSCCPPPAPFFCCW